MSNRIAYFDLAKGICIILVVLFHFQELYGISLPTDKYFDIIRMPLYFFLSGFFFKTYAGFLFFLKRKTDRLLIPFIFFYLTTSVILPIVATYTLGIHFNTGSEWSKIYAFLTYSAFPNYPLWFLWALMIVNIIFFLIVQLCKRSYIAIGIICLLFTILLGKFSNFRLPASFNMVFDGLWFFYLGYFIKNFHHNNVIYKDKFTDTTLLIFYIIVYILLGSVTSEYISLLVLQRYIGGACGILTLLYICERVNYIPYISFVGRFSIILLVTHEPLIRTLSMGNLPPYFAIPILFASYLLIIPLMTTYMPHVTAQKEIFS